MGVVFQRLLSYLGIPGIVGIVVAAILGTMLFLKDREADRWQTSSTKFEQLYKGEKSAHTQTKLNYMFAAEKAREADLKNKQRAEAEQRATVERTKRDYEARIADARARYQRLLNDHRAAGHSGSPGTAPMPGHPAPRSPAPGAPEDRGLSLDERLVATEQAIQLDALIDYVDGLLKVDMNGRREPSAHGRP